jgi:hypothetical protein
MPLFSREFSGRDRRNMVVSTNHPLDGKREAFVTEIPCYRRISGKICHIETSFVSRFPVITAL